MMNADNYVEILSREQKRKYEFAAENQEGLKQWQQEFRGELVELLGIKRIKDRGLCGFNPVCLDVVQMEDYIREEWRITTEPGYEISFYLLKPLKQEGPLPLVITPHGHGPLGKNSYVGIYRNEEERQLIAERQRDIAVQAVREGYMVIANCQRGFGESRMKAHIESNINDSCRTMQMHALLFGRTLIGERVWDISRLIDYAETLKDIDTRRIVVMGNSGGGTAALFASAVDTRISISVPSSYFCTFQGSIGSIRHCECNYIPGIMTLGEMYDVAGLIAPRPFLAIVGKEDQIFPVEASKYAFEKLRKVYEAAGEPERCELYIGDGGHRFYRERAWTFVKKWIDSNR